MHTFPIPGKTKLHPLDSHGVWNLEAHVICVAIEVNVLNHTPRYPVLIPAMLEEEYHTIMFEVRRTQPITNISRTQT